MGSEFDASLIWNSPIAEEVAAAHRKEVEHLMTMPGALSNARLHAERDLERLFKACNRAAWGTVPDDPREPSATEAAELLNRLGADEREALLKGARLAAEQRHLLGLMDLAERQFQEQLRAEQEEEARKEALRLEWEEFEAYDAAGKQQRFEAWRASRTR